MRLLLSNDERQWMIDGYSMSYVIIILPTRHVLEVLDSSQVGWRLFKVGCVGCFVGDASLEELYCVHKQGCLPYYRPDRTIHGCNKPSRLATTPQHVYLWSTLKFFYFYFYFEFIIMIL